MARRYHILDVFTNAPLAGNPLAVVLDGQGLDGSRMQAIAREFNLSETVFVTPPRDAINSAAVRIFTPAVELPFAGHPVIGTAALLGQLQAPELLAREDIALVLEASIGPISCAVRHRRGEAAHARFDLPLLPGRAGPAPTRDVLAASLGLETEDIGFHGHDPSSFSAGVPFVFVPVASIEALGRANPWASGTTEARLGHYLYTPDPRATARTFRARMFGQGLGVAEDPGTGSAVAAFAGVLAEREPLADGEHDCFIDQGVEMGRPCRIGLAFTTRGGQLVEAAIGGSVVRVGEGSLAL